MKIQPFEGPLQLTNDGQLELVFLGTGTAFAQSLYQTNFVIIKGDTHILVDFGMTGPQALADVGRAAEDIGAILPTHSHADHIGGLEYLTLRNRYVGIPSGRPKLSMLITEEYREVLWSQSLRGGLEYNEVHGDGHRLQFEDLYDIHTIQPVNNSIDRSVFRIDYKGIHLELFHTNHIPGEAETARDAFITYGLMIDGRVFVSGDTKFDPELISLYGGAAEALFHDASLTRNAVHASVNELLSLPAEVRQKMYLMHYQDEATPKDAEGFAGLALRRMRYIFD